MPDGTSDRFPGCLDEVLKQEGGYADDPRDPGGATNMGITRATLARWRGVTPSSALPKAAVKSLSHDEAAAIYRAHYWQPIKGGQMPAGLDLAMFDFAVNSGPRRAIKALQATLGVRVDGIAGPITLAAISPIDPAHLIDALCIRRLGFLRRLASFATFGRGWSRRVAEIRSASLAMAGAAPTPPTQRTTDMTFLAGYRTYIVAAAMLIAGIAGLVGVDIPSFTGQAPGTLVMEALAFFFLRQGLKTSLTKS